MTFLTGMLALDIQAGAPNRGRSEEANFAGVKTLTAGRNRTYPYISAQALRRWWRDTLTIGGFTPSPVTRVSKKASTACRGDRYADDDLFGYMATVAKGTTIQRDTVLATGTLRSVHPQRPTRDWGTMARGLQPGEDPLPHQHDHYTAEMTTDIRLDLTRVGVFALAGTATPDLADTAITEALEAGATEITVRGHRALALPLPERRARAAALWQALAELDGGASRNLHYGDRTPALVVLAPLAGAANPFTRLLRPATRAEDGDTVFDLDVLRQQVSAWRDRLAGPVRIGWAPGFLGAHREDVLTRLADEDMVTVDHPRTMLRGLAEEITSGQHDDWFTPIP